MTDDERHLIGVFLYSLTLLRVDEESLTPGNDLSDMNAVAKLCLDVKAITAPGDTPEQLSLHRLACLTEDLLITYVFPDRQVVKAWMCARAELLDLRLAANNG
jgi:hypothetical protein